MKHEMAKKRMKLRFIPGSLPDRVARNLTDIAQVALCLLFNEAFFYRYGDGILDKVALLLGMLAIVGTVANDEAKFANSFCKFNKWLILFRIFTIFLDKMGF